ncbi:MAG: hypothetical protein MSH41_08095 [Bacteroidales bacterium]|nr:hypothetical protein [Bacteroidales bacterium]
MESGFFVVALQQLRHYHFGGLLADTHKVNTRRTPHNKGKILNFLCIIFRVEQKKRIKLGNCQQAPRS